MDNMERGKLVLKAVPTGETEKKVVTLLLKFAKTASPDELTAKVRNAPYELSKDIEAEKAVLFIDAFQRCGATAVFVPHETAPAAVETAPPVEKEVDFSFGSFMDEEPAPPPLHVKAPKSRSRRLTMLLVITLLFLSFGFLANQLWPVLGVKVQEVINTIKQLF